MILTSDNSNQDKYNPGNDDDENVKNSLSRNA